MFLVAYGIMYAVGGRIVDRLGTRMGYAVMIAWWSLACVLQGAVHSLAGIAVTLFLLGLGEGGGFPASAKAVSEWFPAAERSFAFGIFNTGSSLGAVVAPPLIAAIVLELGWRWVFFIIGTVGLLWAVAWMLLYEIPSRHMRVTPAERGYVESGLVAARDPAPQVPWLSLFRYRQVWGLVGAKLLSDSAWFFFIFWLPKYLGDMRHLKISGIGRYGWIPYAGAGVGSFIGGWLSSYLIRRKFSINASRKIALGFGAACVPASLLIAASPLAFAIAFFSVAMFGHQFWSTNLQTLGADLFPSKTVGAVAGLMGAAGSIGAMAFSLLVGALLSRFHSYGLVFTITGLLHPLSFVLILLVVRRIEPVAGAGIDNMACMTT
jgi:ACS family hexuronate transporter-like MFS transporter